MKSLYDSQSNQTLSPEELEAIRPMGRVCHFKDGEPIFEAGDRPCDFFFMVSGEAEVIEPWSDPPLCLTEGSPEISIS